MKRTKPNRINLFIHSIKCYLVILHVRMICAQYIKLSFELQTQEPSAFDKLLKLTFCRFCETELKSSFFLWFNFRISKIVFLHYLLGKSYFGCTLKYYHENFYWFSNNTKRRKYVEMLFKETYTPFFKQRLFNQTFGKTQKDLKTQVLKF